jgi:hypothetical protein
MRLIMLPTNEVVSIEKKPWWLFWVPVDYAITLYPIIYVGSELYEDTKDNMHRFIHESVHLRQQKDNRWKFYWKYIVSRKFRYSVELEAYLAETQYQKDSKAYFNIAWFVDYVASQLSSWHYLWCVSYNKAESDLKAGIK